MAEPELIGGRATISSGPVAWRWPRSVPYTLTGVMPHTPEVARSHPFGRSLVMRHGGVQLADRAQSGLHDRAFDGPALIPADIAKAAVDRAMGLDRERRPSTRCGCGNILPPTVFRHPDAPRT
jgi:hypothetical protein